jgi:hypothetical protein
MRRGTVPTALRIEGKFSLDGALDAGTVDLKFSHVSLCFLKTRVTTNVATPSENTLARRGGASLMTS